ncbi:MAG: serine hydrolase [bacterium]|nr:serine hydrolase [bacterium]
MMKSLTALALVFANIASPAFAQSQSTTTPAAADHPEKTPSGATFTAPAGWNMSTKPKLIELSAPEGDFRIALVDIGAAPDVKAAVAAAWSLWAPTNARPPKLVTARAARNGWDERQVVDYEVSPNEKRVMQASALRAGTAWTVVIIDGNEATVEKRLAAMGLVIQSVRPAGYSRESFAGKTAHPMDAARIERLKAFVAQSMKELGIPGAAFSLTTKEKTIYSTGLGVRLLGDPTPVDTDSAFLIASNTKGLATLMLAKLVDEGKLRWDEPVSQAYPPFKLGSAATTQKVLIRHLVCACTGLPRKDMQVLLNSDPNAAALDTFAQLAATEPTSGFGEVFQYNNLMAAAA